MHDIEIILSTFLAAGVEWVEAFTIVLAVALTIGWGPASLAAGAAFCVLAAMVAAGSFLLTLIPNFIWVQGILGVFLILFGLRWLAKAVARGAGLQPLHDETAEFAVFSAEAAQAEHRAAWMIAFNGTLLEGLEVWLIVVALGVQSRHTLIASAAAIAALLAVIAAGAALRQPLARVPENAIKFAVGCVMLAFGSFWVVQATGYVWPFGDFALPLLAIFYAVAGLSLIRRLSLPETHPVTGP